jgi:hypothetical protein
VQSVGYDGNIDVPARYPLAEKAGHSSESDMYKLAAAVAAALILTPLIGEVASAANYGGVPLTRAPGVRGGGGGGGGGAGVRGPRGGGGGGINRGGGVNRGGFYRGRGGYRGGGYRGSRFGSSIYIGPGFGPWYDPFWYDYGYPYRYGYGYGYYAPPPVIVRESPPVEELIPPDAPPPPQNWYYCRDPEGYYPYVRSCNGPWEEVPANPPGEGQTSSDDNPDIGLADGGR